MGDRATAWERAMAQPPRPASVSSRGQVAEVGGPVWSDEAKSVSLLLLFPCWEVTGGGASLRKPGLICNSRFAGLHA